MITLGFGFSTGVSSWLRFLKISQVSVLLACVSFSTFAKADELTTSAVATPTETGAVAEPALRERLAAGCALILGSARDFHPVKKSFLGAKAAAQWLVTDTTKLPALGAEPLFVGTPTAVHKLEHYLYQMFYSVPLDEQTPALGKELYRDLLTIIRSGNHALTDKDPGVVKAKYGFDDPSQVTVHEGFKKTLEIYVTQILSGSQNQRLKVINYRVLKPWRWSKTSAIVLSSGLLVSVWMAIAHSGVTAYIYNVNAHAQQASFVSRNMMNGQTPLTPSYGMNPDFKAADRQYIDMNASYLHPIQEATDRSTKLLLVVQQVRMELKEAKAHQDQSAIELQLELMLQQESLYGEVIRGLYGDSIKQLIDQTLKEYDADGALRAKFVARAKSK